jgi:hypothetical protein
MEVSNLNLDIKMKKRTEDDSELESIPFTDWGLKLNFQDLHELNFGLKVPDEFININSPTGTIYTIGDEVGFWANIDSDEYADDFKRFGGVISSFDNEWNGTTQMSLICHDYRKLWKNRLLFKEYYKTKPISLGKSSFINNYLKRVNTLSDIVNDLGSKLGYDISQVESPYLFKRSNASNLDITKTTGTNSSIEINTQLKYPANSYGFRLHKNDSEVVYNLYTDGTGFDLNEYDSLVFNYFLPKTWYTKIGFRFIVNGTKYYVPWTSNLAEYTDGYKLPGVGGVRDKKMLTRSYPINAYLDQYYPDTDYVCTQIDIVAKKTGGVCLGTNDTIIVMNNIGMIDSRQLLPPTMPYLFTTYLDAVNRACDNCDHLFDITPNKQVMIHDYDSLVTTKSLIEGDNILSCKISANDDDLVNNQIMISNLKNYKGIWGQSQDTISQTRHGIYDKADENDEIKDARQLQGVCNQLVYKGSTIVPSISVSVPLTFDYNPGETVYVSVPSLGIDKTYQIMSISISQSGTELTLGTPQNRLAKKLKKLTKNMRMGLRRGTESLDATANSYMDMGSPPHYTNPLQKIVFQGKQMVEPSIDPITDTIWEPYGCVIVNGQEVCSYNDYPVIPEYLKIGTTLTNDGLLITATNAHEYDYDHQYQVGSVFKIPLGINTNMNNFGQLNKIEVTYNFSNMSGGTDVWASLGTQIRNGMGEGQVILKNKWASYTLSQLGTGDKKITMYDKSTDGEIIPLDSYYLILTGLIGNESSNVNGNMLIKKVEVTYNTI